MTQVLQLIDRWGTTSGLGEGSDPDYLNAGGYVAKEGDYLLSMRRPLPASASVVYGPGQQSGAFSIILFHVDPVTGVLSRAGYKQIYGLVNFFPGEVRAHPLHEGSLLYTGHSGAIVILDISNPTSIVELGRYVEPNTVTRPKTTRPAFVTPTGVLWGNWEAGSTGPTAPNYDGIDSFDVSNPAAIARLATYHEGYVAWGQTGFTIAGRAIGWDDRWLATIDYASGVTYGVRIWDITNPTGPTVLATWTGMNSSSRPQTLQTFELSGSRYMIVTLSADSGHVLFDVTNPAVPVQVGGFAPMLLSGGTNNQSVQMVEWAPWLAVGTVRDSNGSYVYLLDYSVPAAPVLLSKIVTYSGGALTTTTAQYTDCVTEEDRVFVTDVNGRAAHYLITDVAAPSSVIGTWAWKGLA